MSSNRNWVKAGITVIVASAIGAGSAFASNGADDGVQGHHHHHHHGQHHHHHGNEPGDDHGGHGNEPGDDHGGRR